MPTWVRVRDAVTGHEYDVAEETLPREGLEPVKDYPENSGLTARPRPAKHRTSKGRRATSEAVESADTTTTKE